MGDTLWLRQQRIRLQCGRPGFNPWVRKIPWRKEQPPTPVILPGEFHGQRSLVGCSSLDHKESDTTERLSLHIHNIGYYLLSLWALKILQPPSPSFLSLLNSEVMESQRGD